MQKNKLEKDDALIVDFIAKNSIVAVKHSSGLYYQTLTPAANGENNFNGSTNVTVTYEGKLLNGTSFDKGTNVTFPLGNLIQGWQIGIPLVKRGGRIRLLVPSTLAYKKSSPGAGRPENAVLDFTIDLLSAQ